MKEITIPELQRMAKAIPAGKKPKIYLHWTAGNYESCFEDYHINITGGGRVFVPSSDLTAHRSHTWQRNTEGIGIALCCAYGAQLDDRTGLAVNTLYPPTNEQIEVMARVICVLLTTRGMLITPETVMTHAEIALIDNYGPYQGDPETKWDLYKLTDYDGSVKDGGYILRGKANWYKENGGM